MNSTVFVLYWVIWFNSDITVWQRTWRLSQLKAFLPQYVISLTLKVKISTKVKFWLKSQTFDTFLTNLTYYVTILTFFLFFVCQNLLWELKWWNGHEQHKVVTQVNTVTVFVQNQLFTNIFMIQYAYNVWWTRWDATDYCMSL